MKIKLLMFALIASSIMAHVVCAQEITCPMNVADLNSQFQQNWQSGQRGYFSTIEFNREGQSFTGALHTDSQKMPRDTNPHLSYAEMQLQQIPERVEWFIDCRYHIANLAMSDLDDGYLHLTTSVNSADKACKKVTDSVVICT